MTRRKFHKWAVTGSVLLVVGALVVAPRWLLYADQPVKSDVIILFVGPGFEDRLIEARRLVREGYAGNLFIPAYHESFQKSRDGRIVDLDRCFIDQSFPAVLVAAKNLPSYYEATHVETIEAKRLMDDCGFRSALFVSSPYHMRRIRMIAGDVFDPVCYRVRYVPAGCVEATSDTMRFDLPSLRWQVSEYLKIGWYLVYAVFD